MINCENITVFKTPLTDYLLYRLRQTDKICYLLLGRHICAVKKQIAHHFPSADSFSAKIMPTPTIKYHISRISRKAMVSMLE